MLPARNSPRAAPGSTPPLRHCLPSVRGARGRGETSLTVAARDAAGKVADPSVLDAVLAYLRMESLYAKAPQWIVNLVLGLVIPRIWSRYLEATKELDAGGGPYVARVTRDERGGYKRLKRAWRDIT